MKTELVFIPLPSTSHLVSTVQFAKLLVGRDEELSITICLFQVPFDADANSYMQSLQSETQTAHGIRYVQLLDPHPQIEAVAKPQNPFILASRLMESQKPQVRNVVSELKESGTGTSRLAGFVVDMFCTAMIEIAKEFQIPAYVYYTSCASMIGLRHHIQCLVDDKCDVSKLRDPEYEFCASTYSNPVPAKLCPSTVVDENAPILKHTRMICSSDGIMVNTFSELESYAIEALNSNHKFPRVYPVGPLINLNGARKNQEDSDIILKWLDDQPISSVVFLCFGSFGSFVEDQVKEIAKAIEQSGCRFLWSLRKPPRQERVEYPSEYENYQQVLPEGFLNRTCTIGKVIGWAPQAQVLAHPAVGGFVTHCGWNSVLESVWFGVPMAAWPMYAEQQMNAFFLVKQLGIAAEIRMDYKKDAMVDGSPVIVRADEIEGGIRKLMQPASEIRNKVKELMHKARTALEEGGSSYISLGHLIEHFQVALPTKE